MPYLRCLDAGFIQHAPAVDGGLCGGVPTRPERTTPRIRFVSLAPHLRSTRPSDPTSRTPLRFPCPSAPRIPGQGTFTPKHDNMHGTHAPGELLVKSASFLPVSSTGLLGAHRFDKCSVTGLVVDQRQRRKKRERRSLKDESGAAAPRSVS